jgi:two-component system nitrogen regulation sensor histidine kinase GlnL
VKSKASLKKIIEIIPEVIGIPILAIDDQGTILYANSSAEETLQESFNNIAKKSAGELIRGIDNFSKYLGEVFSGKRVMMFDITIYIREGDKIPLEYLELAPLTAPGEAERFTLISFRKKDESFVEKFIGNEEPGSDNFDIVWRGISHEVNNPLGGIRGAAQMLLNNLEKNSPFRDHARVILRETDRIARFLEGLPSFAHVDRRCDVDVFDVLTEAIELVKTHMASIEKEIKIKIIADTSLPKLHCDTDALFRVFTNLLKNSVEAIERKGTIRVTLKLHEDLVYETKGKSKNYIIEIEFFDSGKEIQEEEIPLLFLPFYTNKPGGSGMGLFYVKNTVKAQGGSIRLKSYPEGKAFKVYLPLKKEER